MEIIGDQNVKSQSCQSQFYQKFREINLSKRQLLIKYHPNITAMITDCTNHRARCRRGAPWAASLGAARSRRRSRRGRG